MAGGNFPGGLDSFVAQVDDLDDVLAADMNAMQVMGVAIETELGTDPAGSCTDVKTRLAHSINDAGWLEFDDCTELTIAGGVVTATQNYHKIDTQGDDATDDLDTINGFTAGLFIVLRSVADARNVVIKHNTGNILCAGAADITLETTGQFAFGVYDTGQSKWMIGHGAATGVTQSGSGANSYIGVYTGASTLEGTDDLQWDGTTLTIGDGTAARDYIITVNGETLNGIITWMEDEDYFKFSDNILMATTEKVRCGSTAIYVNSDTDGHLDLHADVSVDLNTAANTDLVLNFTGTTTSGILTWMEDEDAFNFADTVMIGQTDGINTKSTLGLTINQGASDDEILTFKSSDIAHGITDESETDTFAKFMKHDATTGGLRLSGFCEDEKSFILEAEYVNESNTRSAAGTAPTNFNHWKKDGTGRAAPAADKNLLIVRAGGNARMIVDSDGDIHLDGASNDGVWDEYDDIALLSGLRGSLLENPARAGLAEFIDYAKPILERTGVVTYNEDGHHFISYKGMTYLMIDAMRQMFGKIRELEGRISA